MPVDVARLRLLFHVGVFSLLLPLMVVIDSNHRAAWAILSGLALIGTVGSIGYLLKTASGLKESADLASVDTVTGLMNTDSLTRTITCSRCP